MLVLALTGGAPSIWTYIIYIVIFAVGSRHSIKVLVKEQHSSTEASSQQQQNCLKYIFKVTNLASCFTLAKQDDTDDVKHLECW